MIPYPAYKSTNLPGLPKIPEHWEIRTIHRICRLQGGSGFPVRYQGCYTESIPFIKVNSLASHISNACRYDTVSRETAELLGAKVFSRGDIVFAKVGAALLLHRFEVLPFDCCIDNNMMAMYHISENNQWLRYTLSLLDFKALVNPGAVPSVNQSQVAAMTIPCPPKNEQEQIVRYLDSMTAKINKLIRAKKKQIALLQEQRQAIINRAVTRGLDPNAEMKDSGIDWIGKIPKHWILNKVGHFYKSILGKMLANTPSSPQDSFEKYLCAKDVHFSGVDLTDLKQMWFSPEEKIKYQVKPGDLLVVEGGAGAGGAAVFHGFSENLYVQNSIHIVRPKQGNTTVQYLYYWICALVGRKYIDYACNKATIPHFTGDKLFEMPFVLAPLAEQKAIVDHLVNICRKYDSIIDKLNNEINLMVEYKNSLISSVVTGQIDVHNISMEDVIPDDLIADDDPTAEIEDEPATDESEEA